MDLNLYSRYFMGKKKRLGFCLVEMKQVKNIASKIEYNLLGYTISCYCLKVERELSLFSVPLLFLSGFWYTLPLNSSYLKKRKKGLI